MKNVLLIFGTRPEIIKLAAVYRALEDSPDMTVDAYWSGQHVELAEGLMDLFGIKVADSGANLRDCPTLSDKFARITADLNRVLEKKAYDWIVVQGDTTTAAAGANAGFLNKIPVAHVEAGLRTWDMNSPWPEEYNRRVISLGTSLHFPPTEAARQNLVAEGIHRDATVVTGNTVIDALEHVRAVVRFNYTPACAELNDIPTDKKLVLITGHRRENFGKPLRNVIEALRQLSQDGDKCLVFPVHLNPNVRRTVFAHLADCENIRLMDPLQYPDFVYLMERCWTVVTDSGGIQEEAPSFHRPILITREVTERPEVLDAGFGELVGTDTARLVKAVRRATSGLKPLHIDGRNPFGNGTAARTIVDTLLNWTAPPASVPAVHSLASRPAANDDHATHRMR